MAKRYQRGNQNLYIRQHNDQKIPEGKSESVYQTTQWPKDTKVAFRIRILNNTLTKRYQRAIRICIYQTTQWPKDTKGEIRIKHNDQKILKGYSEYVYQTTQ